MFVNLHGWWLDPEHVFVAMEYLRHGDLAKYDTLDFQETEIKEIADNILRGLKAMHREGYTHRDIKPQVCIPSTLFPTLFQLFRARH